MSSRVADWLASRMRSPVRFSFLRCSSTNWFMACRNALVVGSYFWLKTRAAPSALPAFLSVLTSSRVRR